MPDSAPLRLEVSHLGRSFGGRKVVDDVSLVVAAGQVTCLLGPSGCGKSTTGRSITRLVEPTSGQISMDGYNVASLDSMALRRMRRSIGVSFLSWTLSMAPWIWLAFRLIPGISGALALSRCPRKTAPMS